MNLWGGRFTKPTDQLVADFNASISFDQKLVYQDIRGSIAHARMLAKQGIINNREEKEIITGLEGILNDLEKGTLEIDMKAEDIHSFIEATLTQRIGTAGKKLHTGRSRNDQVATDMRLYVRDQIVNLQSLTKNLLLVLDQLMTAHLDTVMPGFTHLQKAQPTTLAHHLGAYFEMFKRDYQRYQDILSRLNYSPLGSGALTGTTYPLDREYTASLLDFTGPCLNSMDGVSDRDYLIELLSNLNTTMMHMSRLCEEMIIWNSNEYQFIELDDTYSTGSSIMPQKKNPDICELIRGKTGRVYGAYMAFITTMKALPLAYNKDMQEDKEQAFDAIETTALSLQLLANMLATTTFNPEKMAQSATKGFTNATDAADYLVNKGVPFRDAHQIIGKLVLLAIQENKDLDNLSLAQYQSISPVFEPDIYDFINIKTCLNRRKIIGSPNKEEMIKVINLNQDFLKSLK